MSPRIRQRVRARAGGRCEYCRLPDWVEFSGPFHVEHVIARQHAGLTEIPNLAWACSRCNAHKGTNSTAIDPDGTGRCGAFQSTQRLLAASFQSGCSTHPRRDGVRTHHILVAPNERRAQSRTAWATNGGRPLVAIASISIKEPTRGKNGWRNW